VPSFSKEELKKAHSHSYKNKDELSKSNKCSCFHCFQTFHSKEIETYLGEYDGKETALCPYCMFDTIIGDASGIELADDLIDALAYKYLHGLTRDEIKNSGGPEIVILDLTQPQFRVPRTLALKCTLRITTVRFFTPLLPTPFVTKPANDAYMLTKCGQSL
jgi:hypothetical protein